MAEKIYNFDDYRRPAPQEEPDAYGTTGAEDADLRATRRVASALAGDTVDNITIEDPLDFLTAEEKEEYVQARHREESEKERLMAEREMEASAAARAMSQADRERLKRATDDPLGERRPNIARDDYEEYDREEYDHGEYYHEDEIPVRDQTAGAYAERQQRQSANNRPPERRDRPVRQQENRSEPAKQPDRRSEPARQPEKRSEPAKQPDRRSEAARQPEKKKEPARPAEKNREPERKQEKCSEPSGRTEREKRAEPVRKTEKRSDPPKQQEKKRELAGQPEIKSRQPSQKDRRPEKNIQNEKKRAADRLSPDEKRAYARKTDALLDEAAEGYDEDYDDGSRGIFIASAILGVLIIIMLIFMIWLASVTLNREEPEAEERALAEAQLDTGDGDEEWDDAGNDEGGFDADPYAELLPSGFGRVDDTVVTTTNLNMRSEPDSSVDNKVTAVPEGTELTRVGVDEGGGWSAVIVPGFDGILYCSNQYLTVN